MHNAYLQASIITNCVFSVFCCQQWVGPIYGTNVHSTGCVRLFHFAQWRTIQIHLSLWHHYQGSSSLMPPQSKQVLLSAYIVKSISSNHLTCDAQT